MPWTDGEIQLSWKYPTVKNSDKEIFEEEEEEEEEEEQSCPNLEKENDSLEITVSETPEKNESISQSIGSKRKASSPVLDTIDEKQEELMVKRRKLEDGADPDSQKIKNDDPHKEKILQSSGDISIVHEDLTSLSGDSELFISVSYYHMTKVKPNTEEIPPVSVATLISQTQEITTHKHKEKKKKKKKNKHKHKHKHKHDKPSKEKTYSSGGSSTQSPANLAFVPSPPKG
ncbi:hypothetical protein GQR58_024621 [Nymphon striatum]|nr:hypothetical protein GQR58_024621 [Nymphon striatum]